MKNLAMPAARISYSGSERRQHKVFVTRHTEYHFRFDRVIAVRSRDEQSWVLRHDALGMQLEGYVAPGALIPRIGSPELGQRLYLVRGEDDVITSPVVAIVRPPKSLVIEYPASR